ncbi:acylneuraminate cytidylyltransferase family protein [bacterium]|nr:acylneuraminate cytidylyltransferase family protein [bacterium]
MEFLAIIPARGGSKGIPRKNIKQLAGKPLIYHTIKAALDSKYISRVILSTEDEEIASVAKACGAEISVRPVELAQDETKTAPVLVDVIEQLAKQNYRPDVVVLLQATCPLRDSKRLDEAIELFINNPDCDSVFSVKKIGLTHALWRENHDGTVLGLYDYRHRPRRQDLDEHYSLMQETGETYIIRTDVLMKIGDFIGEKPIFHIVDNSVDIDTEEDFKFAEEFLCGKY